MNATQNATSRDLPAAEAENLPHMLQGTTDLKGDKLSSRTSDGDDEHQKKGRKDGMVSASKTSILLLKSNENRLGALGVLCGKISEELEAT
jgi:hypothetical protein